MKHRHPGLVSYKTKKGRIMLRKRPLHVQTLIFPKKKFSRRQALSWAEKHGFQHYTSRETGDSVRLRQFPPSDVRRYGGTFPLGDGIKGVYAEVNKEKYKNKPYSYLRRKFNIPVYADDDKDGVPNYKDCRPWDRKRHSIFFGDDEYTKEDEERDFSEGLSKKIGEKGEDSLAESHEEIEKLVDKLKKEGEL